MDPHSDDTFTRELEQRVGAVLDGKYHLTRLLGAGATGAVYAALNPTLGRTFAIKVLHPHLSGSREIAERFRREAQASNRITTDAGELHPNVVDVVDAGRTSEGLSYLVEPLLRGETLEERLARSNDHRLSIGDSVAILRPVLEAIASAHAIGIVHRDLKPANVFLVDRAGAVVPKVMDFGIAQFADARITGDHDFLGTPYYMAPEGIISPHEVDARIDVWALAVIFYEMLEGVLPFRPEGPSWFAMGDVLLRKPPRPMTSKLTDVQQAWFARSLEKDRANRFQDAAEQLAAFDRAFPG